MRCKVDSGALRVGAGLLTLLAMFLAAPSVYACPLCKEAIASPGSGDDEINNAPAAYNTSIYLMAGVPYVLLGSVGFLIYRGCQRNAEFLGQQPQGWLRGENENDKMPNDG